AVVGVGRVALLVARAAVGDARRHVHAAVAGRRVGRVGEVAARGRGADHAFLRAVVAREARRAARSAAQVVEAVAFFQRRLSGEIALRRLRGPGGRLRRAYHAIGGVRVEDGFGARERADAQARLLAALAVVVAGARGDLAGRDQRHAVDVGVAFVD